MFAAGEECRYGDHCNFAHGRHELRKPTFYKKYEAPAEDDNQVTVLLLISMMSLLFAKYNGQQCSKLTHTVHFYCVFIRNLLSVCNSSHYQINRA